MRWSYSCPHCRVMLNPDESITLLVECKSRVFLVGLHPEPGNYQMYLPPGVPMCAEGCRCTFRCPACHEDLVTEVSDNLCALDVHQGGETHRVFFSRITGEQATFLVTAEGLREDYGIHTDRYVEALVHRSFR